MSYKRGFNDRDEKRNIHSLCWVSGIQQSDAEMEKALALLQPDTLICDEYAATCKRRLHLEPERNLMLAILEDALVCFCDNVAARDRRKQQLFLEAEEWLLEESSNYLYSFVNICDSLGLSPGYLRRVLMIFKQQAAAAGVQGRMAG